MRGNRSHLSVVRTPEAAAASGPDVPVAAVSVAAVSVVRTATGANVIRVRAENLVPGQVCEVLHNGVFSLSHSVVVPAGESIVTMSTFALAGGRYEVSLRIDGTVQVPAVRRTVFVRTRNETNSSAV